MDKYTDVIKQFSKTFLDSFTDINSDIDSGRVLEEEIVNRDKKYTDLLDSYVGITKTRNCVKEIHKWIFFWIVIISCVFVVYLVYRTVDRILSQKEYTLVLESIPILITAFVSCITTVVAIPLAITKFLFNTNEDDNIASIIKHMQEHDMKGLALLKDRFNIKEDNFNIDYLNSDNT